MVDVRTTAARPCDRCGLIHTPGQLFVEVAPELLIDTCELDAARAAAHREPSPRGTRAYHATHTTQLDAVLEHGLDPKQSHATCAHVALDETPGMAAAVLLPTDGQGVRYRAAGFAPRVVLAVDVSGLDLFFELGEARHHDTVIQPERL